MSVLKNQIPAKTALTMLQQGNARFAADCRERSVFNDRTRREALVSGQKPFAIILGCSDSRVPAEIVFDQGLGDLFVIRVAGNIVAPSQVGSVEFAAECFGTQLVVVLGHSNCGAVKATLEELTRPNKNCSQNLRAIVDRIRPSLEQLNEGRNTRDLSALTPLAVKANIRESVQALRNGSEILKRMVAENRLLVIGAEYSLETGLVEFLDHPAEGESSI